LPAAAGIDHERLVTGEPGHQVQAGLAGDGEPGGQGVGQPQVGTDHAGRGRARGRASGAGINQVLAPLVGPGRRDGPGQLDHLGQAIGRKRVGDADPERPAGTGAAGAGDIAGRVDQHAAQAAGAERGEGTLRGPALDVAGRVEPTGHGPRVEPAPGPIAGHRAALEHFGQLGGGLRAGDLAPAQPADRAIRPPGAEDLVGPVQDGHRVGQLAVQHVVGRARHGIDVDDHDRAHHLFEVMNDASAARLGAGGHRRPAPGPFSQSMISSFSSVG
jgi:hypothetical protein